MAEPAINGNNLIGFDGTNDRFPNGRPFPVQTTPPEITPIKTNDTNIITVSKPLIENNSPQENVREILDDGVIEKVKVGTFLKNGFIRLTGNYSQNFVDLPTYDLSVINVVNDEDVTFNFILCIKDGNDSEPQLYTTTKFFNTLQKAYNDNNPISANYLINERKIVVIDIQPLKNKIEDLRVLELNQDINLTNVAEKDYVTVFRNLFSISNYETDSVSGYKSNPTYKIIELLRYISWVVSKPAQNYNERILPAQTLGEWGDIEVLNSPSPNEPSTPINDEVDDNNNITQPQANLYPPIGRKGRYDEEEVAWNNRFIVWLEDEQRWTILNKNNDPIRAFTFKV